MKTTIVRQKNMAKYLLNDFIVKKHIESALQEDIGYGDISTDFICANLSDDKKFTLYLSTRQDCVFCGKDVFKLVFDVLSDKKVEIEFYCNDGDVIKKGDKVAKIVSHPRFVLTGERLALNYIQRLSGIATYAKMFSDKIEKYSAKVVDTRKNTPNFRIFEKYALMVGGCSMHRFNLNDCVMLKDNHIALFDGSISKAVQEVRKNLSHAHKIEVECDTLDQVKEALDCKVDIIMLDNMSIEQTKTAVELIDGRAVVEASGNVSLDTIEEIAKTGVDVISTSALVSKAPTIDLGFDYID